MMRKSKHLTKGEKIIFFIAYSILLLLIPGLYRFIVLNKDIWFPYRFLAGMYYLIFVSFTISKHVNLYISNEKKQDTTSSENEPSPPSEEENELVTSIDSVDNMTGHEFEKFITRLLEKTGYNATLTERGGDFGIDAVARKNKTSYAIQIKRWKNNVGRRAVSDAVSGKNYKDCQVAVVITNQYYTDSAQEFAKKTDCILIDRTDLKRVLDDPNEYWLETKASLSIETTYKNEKCRDLYEEANNKRKDNNTDEAETLFRKAMRLHEEKLIGPPSPKLYRTFSKMLYHLGRTEEAVNILNRYLSHHTVPKKEEMQDLRDRFKSEDFKRMSHLYEDDEQEK